MTGLDLAIGLLVGAVALGILAERLTTPRPVVFALGGLALGVAWHLIPGTPVVRLAPDLVLELFLPPVLAWAGFTVPLGAFRANLRWIVLLAVGLVFATMAVVAAVAHALDPALPWAAAFALGALLAPPDPVAATSVGGRLGLRNALVTILAGEGMVNDATSLVAYQLAVAAAVTGRFTWGHAGLEFLRETPVGVGVGLAVAWLTATLRRRLHDPVIETALSLATPYVAYVAAGWVGGSSVLAVVAFGFYLQRRATDISDPPTRLATRTVWRTVDFVVSGFVFLLVGAELGRAAAGALGATVVWQGALVSAAVIALRLAWMQVVPRVVYRVSGTHGQRPASTAERTVLGWAGMRGVVSLALALALPARVASGAPFPARERLVLVAYGVIFVTLVLQGLTLAPLIRRLGVGDPGRARREEAAARREAGRAGVAQFPALAGGAGLSADEREGARAVLDDDLGLDPGPDADGEDGRGGAADDPARRIRRVLHGVLVAERDAVLAMRDDGRVSDEVAQELTGALNVDALRVPRAARRAARGGAGQARRAPNA